MQILHICPANVATGGTESIHRLISTLCKLGADAKILYVGKSHNPQPSRYKDYGCEYITEFPADFKGVVIFPEIFANQIIEQKYSDCTVVVNWQGVDVYNWSVPERERGQFLKRGDAIHIANCEYAINYLYQLGIDAIKVSDRLEDAYFQSFDGEFERRDEVLYNPTAFKLTDFQKIIMARCQTEYGIKFKPLQGYSVDELISIFRHSKLYIDFGVFSGRERLPREAVMCGCCVLTSTKGAASYFNDVPIPYKYKMESIEDAVKMIRTVLQQYEDCRPDFDCSRHVLEEDRSNYENEVRNLYEILNNNSSL